MTRGGLRPNSGRPKEAASKAVRLREDVADKAKSGFYEELEALVNDWQLRAEDADSSTRDWTKMREFLAELAEIKKLYP